MSSEGEIGRGDRLRRRCTVEFCGGVRVGGRGRLLVFFFSNIVRHLEDTALICSIYLVQ